MIHFASAPAGVKKAAILNRTGVIKNSSSGTVFFAEMCKTPWLFDALIRGAAGSPEPLLSIA